jgi:rubrerythrin
MQAIYNVYICEVCGENSDEKKYKWIESKTKMGIITGIFTAPEPQIDKCPDCGSTLNYMGKYYKPAEGVPASKWKKVD